MRCAVRCQVEALRSEVGLAVERAESRAAEGRAQAAAREAGLVERCAEAERRAEGLKVRAVQCCVLWAVAA